MRQGPRKGSGAQFAEDQQGDRSEAWACHVRVLLHRGNATTKPVREGALPCCLQLPSLLPTLFSLSLNDQLIGGLRFLFSSFLGIALGLCEFDLTAFDHDLSFHIRSEERR